MAGHTFVEVRSLSPSLEQLFELHFQKTKTITFTRLIFDGGAALLIREVVNEGVE